MRYFVTQDPRQVPHSSDPVGILIHDNWNDWFEYKTLFQLRVRSAGEETVIGQVKIGQKGLGSLQDGEGIPRLKAIFEGPLDEQFFSLGQDEDYFTAALALRDNVGVDVLKDLRDVSANLSILRENEQESSLNTSLLRSISRTTVEGRFARLAQGNARLTNFSFVHLPAGLEAAPEISNCKGEDGCLSFAVAHERSPPTNIHVLIGRNGVGKTTRLTQIIHALLKSVISEDKDPGQVLFYQDDWLDGTVVSSEPDFANMVSVSFSAFDPFVPPEISQLASSKLKYAYIGLKRPAQSTPTEGGSESFAKHELAAQFVASASVCRRGVKRERWTQALNTLEADPLFEEANVVGLAEDGEVSEAIWGRNAKKLFNRLSSGHAIVLLTMTRLVELVDEKSLVLLDEPEGHLHPPLLAAFVRALSVLLTRRNGVALIATHSPVVLQEVPASCVWYLHRSAGEVWANRPERETFGENVGVLTRDVFGLEVNKSGFHKLIAEAVKQSRGDYDEVVAHFNGELGEEAQALIRFLSLRFKNSNSAAKP